MKSPCRDRATGADCPRRKAGCAANCPDWAEYVDERNKAYKVRAQISDISHSANEARSVRYYKALKRRRNNSRWG